MTSKDESMKPCPFCGAAPRIELIPAHKHVVATFMPAVCDTWVLECVQCPAGFCGGSREEVIAEWNKRAPLPDETTAHRQLNGEQFDLLAWAYAKLLKFGVGGSNAESALKMDAIKLALETPGCWACGLTATDRCPYCEALTCGKCQVCEHEHSLTTQLKASGEQP